MDDPWGIDLEERIMKFEPWKIDSSGEYITPTDNEIEEIFGVSGGAVNESFNYFIKCGGDTKKLINLLSEHLIDDRFVVTKDLLFNRENWYTNEFYFYFQMFCKKIIGRYDWHYGEGKDLVLSKYHKIYEKGFLKFIPYGGEEKDATHAIPFAFMEFYGNQGVDFSDYIDWVESLVKYKSGLSYKDEVSKIRDIKLCGELAYYIYEFLKIRLNKNNLATCVDEGFEVYNMSGLSYFPKSMVISALTFISNKSSKNIRLEMQKNGKNKFLCNIHTQSDYKVEKYDKYKKSIFINIHNLFVQTIKKVFIKIYNLDTEPEIENITELGSESYIFNLKVKPQVTLRNITIFFKLMLIAVIGFIILNNPFNINYYILLVIFIIMVIIDYIFTKKNKKWNDNRILNTIRDSNEKISEMEHLSENLIIQKEALEKKVNERTKELEQKNFELKHIDMAKTNFFTNISHEFRTPLTIIIGTLDCIINGKYGNKINNRDPIFLTMQKNGFRLLRQIENILNYASLESGKKNLQKITFDPVEKIRIYSSMFTSLIEQRNLYFDFNTINEEQLLISFDIDLFETLFFNILSNSIKYTKKGGITVSIDKIEKNNKPFINIKIMDTGIGIPSEKISLIFERFHQVENTLNRKYEGTGIGMALCREIIENHDGEISVNSEPGNWTEVELLIPLAKDNNITEKTDRTTQKYHLADIDESINNIELCNTNTNTHTNTKILLVEDNSELCNFINTHLSKNYDVYIAKNGIEGLKILNNEKISLIISDIMMPEMDGIAFKEKISGNPVLNKIPFIFLTAKVEQDQKLKALSDGVIDFIIKPFKIDELLLKINNILSRDKLIKDNIVNKISNMFENEETNINDSYSLDAISEKYGLTRKEREVLKCIIDGNMVKEISFKLNISVRTVQTHINKIYKKTKAANRFELLSIVNVN